MVKADLDIQWLKEAIRIAGQCSNVAFYGVGCVIVKEGKLISTGYTGERKEEFKGSLQDLHAEEVALLKAQEQGLSVEAACLYSTLEPCCPRKSGRKPCALRIIENGVARVVFGAKEPFDERLGIYCQGEDKLRAAGLEVVHFSALENECLASALKARPCG